MLYWSQIPLVRLVLPFALGIVLSTHLLMDATPFTLAIIVISLLNLVLFVHLAFKSFIGRYSLGIFLNVIMALLGIILVFIRHGEWEKDKISIDEKTTWLGVVEEMSTLSDSSYKIIVQLATVSHNNNLRNTNNRLQLYLRTKKEVAIGDRIVATSYLNVIPSVKNPGSFDYATFMSRRGVFYQSYINDFEKVGEKWPLERTASAIRNKLISNYEEMGIANENLAVLVAISLGDKTYLENDLREKYAAAGVMHILAVSGLHLGIVFLIFSFLLTPVEKLSHGKIIKGFLLLFFIWFFAFLTGFSPSVQRAALMFSFIVVASINKYNTNVLNSIAGSALLILIVNPMMIFEVGFQLSYAAVIGIVLVHPVIYRLWKMPNGFLDKIWSLVVVSLAAQLATLPIVLFYFHQFPNWFLLANLFVIPLAFFIVSSAVIITLSFVLFSSSFGLNYLLIGALYLVNYIVDALKFLPFFISEDLWISQPSAIILGIALFLFMAYLNNKKLSYFKTFLLLFMVMLGIEFLINLVQSQKRSFNIYATNGESIYSFVNGLSAIVLIDDSISDYSKQIVHNHLKSLRIREYEFHSLSKSYFYSTFNYIKSTNHALFSFDKRKILFSDLSLMEEVEGMCEFDYLVLKKGNAMKESHLGSCPSEIIFDGSILPWDKDYNKLTKKELFRAVNEHGFHSIY